MVTGGEDPGQVPQVLVVGLEEPCLRHSPPCQARPPPLPQRPTDRCAFRRVGRRKRDDVNITT